jgi:hypothetical protein
MAYKKPVPGRSYPFLYNVTMTVGSRKSVEYGFAAPYVPAYQEPVIPGWTPSPQSTSSTKSKASYEPNKRDDVMLVQYLLKRVYQLGNNLNPPLNQENRVVRLTIDGIYGLRTQSAIEHFQLEMRRQGKNIATDGCVDPELGNSVISAVSKTDYTISWLNKCFWILYPQLAPDIRVDPECPPELKLVVSNPI